MLQNDRMTGTAVLQSSKMLTPSLIGFEWRWCKESMQQTNCRQRTQSFGSLPRKGTKQRANLAMKISWVRQRRMVRKLCGQSSDSSKPIILARFTHMWQQLGPQAKGLASDKTEHRNSRPQTVKHKWLHTWIVRSWNTKGTVRSNPSPKNLQSAQPHQSLGAPADNFVLLRPTRNHSPGSTGQVRLWRSTGGLWKCSSGTCLQILRQNLSVLAQSPWPRNRRKLLHGIKKGIHSLLVSKLARIWSRRRTGSNMLSLKLQCHSQFNKIVVIDRQYVNIMPQTTRMHTCKPWLRYGNVVQACLRRKTATKCGSITLLARMESGRNNQTPVQEECVASGSAYILLSRLTMAHAIWLLGAKVCIEVPQHHQRPVLKGQTLQDFIKSQPPSTRIMKRRRKRRMNSRNIALKVRSKRLQ